jgi:hypothetical protein
MMPYTCKNGLIKNVTVDNCQCLNGDGISLMNGQNIRITGCKLNTSDDGIYIFTSYKDPRGGTWWSSDDPQPSTNIEIDNNYCTVTNNSTKALAFILWGANCPDQRLVEVSNVYIHDNYFETMGVWNDDPYDAPLTIPTPVKNVRFENNSVGWVQGELYATPISGLTGFNSMSGVMNGDFERTGEAYWIIETEGDSSACAVLENENYFGCVEAASRGDAKLYQGIHLVKDVGYLLEADVMSSETGFRLFVRDAETDAVIAVQPVSGNQWNKAVMEFSVPENGNYKIGIEQGEAVSGWARIDNAVLGRIAPEGYNTIFTTHYADTFDSDTFYELGTRFSATASGTITAVRLFTSAEEKGVHTVRIWDYEKETVIAGPFAWDVQPGVEGWQEFTLPEGVHIEANRKYVVAVSTGDGNIYAKGVSISNSLTTTVKNGYLMADAGGGLYTKKKGTMPNTSHINSNYLRDVVFVPDDE